MLKNKNIAFIGAGSMAEAMVSGMISKRKVAPENIFITNRSNHQRREELRKKYRISVVQNTDFAISEADIIVLAMKPKDLEQSLDDMRNKLDPQQLLLSVVAGISTSYIESKCKQGQKVIRVMPNTSSMIGESYTAITPGTTISAHDLEIAKALLESVGKVSVIEEKHMDVFTGIAGSGPAYIYYMMEHMEKAGVEQGLDPVLAREIAVQTILGAGKMVMETKESPDALRKKVTSPNGTTQAGLQALEEHGGGKAVLEAVKGASRRSKEISKKFETEPAYI